MYNLTVYEEKRELQEHQDSPDLSHPQTHPHQETDLPRPCLQPPSTPLQYSPLHPEFDMPQSAKAHLEPIRKKMFSNAKLVNNENFSRVNLTPGSPHSALQESSKAYDQLKNKINNLEGRLVEIKKNF